MSTARPRSLHLAALAAGLLAAPAAHAQQTVRLPEEDRALALRPTPVYAIGSAEGREWEMFSRVDQVAFDRADNLYVLDSGASRVVVFDRDGKFVRQFGKKGGGPGEFQAAFGMTVLADGSVAVADLAARSYSLFGADGRYQRSAAFPDDYMPMALGGGGIAAHPRGGVVTAVRQAPSMTMDGAMRRQTLQSTPIVWQSFAAGAKPVRLFDAPTEINTRTQGSAPREGEQRMMVRMSTPVFAPRVNWGVLPAGEVVVSHTPGYTLKVMRDGQPVRYIQRPVRERRVTEADRERARERRREQMRTGEGMRVVSVGPGSGGLLPRSRSADDRGAGPQHGVRGDHSGDPEPAGGRRRAHLGGAHGRGVGRSGPHRRDRAGRPLPGHGGRGEAPRRVQRLGAGGVRRDGRAGRGAGGGAPAPAPLTAGSSGPGAAG
jgi:hypothetical protein